MNCDHCGRFVSFYSVSYSNPSGEGDANWYCSKCGWTGGPA